VCVCVCARVRACARCPSRVVVPLSLTFASLGGRFALVFLQVDCCGTVCALMCGMSVLAGGSGTCVQLDPGLLIGSSSTACSAVCRKLLNGACNLFGSVVRSAQ
jgi:hypothetical protein